MKTLLVVWKNDTNDKPLPKRFKKILDRHANETREVLKGVWFVKTDVRPPVLAVTLAALFDDNDGNKLIVNTLMTDGDHLNGWLGGSHWKWVK